ncbi:MAG: helix-turn-helix domain-containing protein [Trebonia sp.]
MDFRRVVGESERQCRFGLEFRDDLAAAQQQRRRVAGVRPLPASDLTPQELLIVRLAARGLSNKDIAARLFLSPRTVGHHLYKAYPKLGVLSRGELRGLGLAVDAQGT